MKLSSIESSKVHPSENTPFGLSSGGPVPQGKKKSPPRSLSFQIMVSSILLICLGFTAYTRQSSLSASSSVVNQSLLKLANNNLYESDSSNVYPAMSLMGSELDTNTDMDTTGVSLLDENVESVALVGTLSTVDTISAIKFNLAADNLSDVEGGPVILGPSDCNPNERLSFALALAGTLLAVVSSGGTALPIALGGLLGTSSAFAGLWSCNDTAELSYEELKDLIDGLIEKAVSKEIRFKFSGTAKEIREVCPQLDDCTHEKLRGFAQDIKGQIKEARTDNIVIQSAVILTAAALQYATLSAFIIMDSPSTSCGYDTKCCRGNVAQYKFVLKETMEMVEEAKDFMSLARNPMTCTGEGRRSSTPYSYHCEHYEKCTNAKKNKWTDGVKWEQQKIPGGGGPGRGNRRRLEGQTDNVGKIYGNCPLKGTTAAAARVASLKARSINKYQKSIQTWWLLVKPQYDLLKKLHAQPDDDVRNLCGKQMNSCPNLDGLDCSCITDEMCGGDLICCDGICGQPLTVGCMFTKMPRETLTPSQAPSRAPRPPSPPIPWTKNQCDASLKVFSDLARCDTYYIVNRTICYTSTQQFWCKNIGISHKECYKYITCLPGTSF